MPIIGVRYSKIVSKWTLIRNFMDIDINKLIALPSPSIYRDQEILWSKRDRDN